MHADRCVRSVTGAGDGVGEGGAGDAADLGAGAGGGRLHARSTLLTQIQETACH